MPVVDSIDELNALLESADDADDARRISNRANSVGYDWAFEKTLLRPLPSEVFDTTLTGGAAGGPLRAGDGALQSIRCRPGCSPTGCG